MYHISMCFMADILVIRILVSLLIGAPLQNDGLLTVIFHLTSVHD